MIETEESPTQFERARDVTSDADGAQRIAWSPMWADGAEHWFEEKIKDLPGGASLRCSWKPLDNAHGEV